MAQNQPSAHLDIAGESDLFKDIDESQLKERIVILQPLTMKIFNSHGIYFPSSLKQKKIMNYEEFLLQYADYPIKMRVCFDENPSSKTMLQRSEMVTAYGRFGLDCCYIATIHKVENVP